MMSPKVLLLLKAPCGHCLEVFRSLWNRLGLHQWCSSQEVSKLLKLAIPITLTLVLQQLPVLVSLLFVGWIGINNDNQEMESSSLNLDAAALGTSVFSITATAIFTGMSSAADTLMSQIYGFGNYKRVGIVFQRGLLISLMANIFIICLLLNIENILLLLQQYPCVAKYTAVYVHILMLAYPFYVLYIMLQKYLQSQSIVWPFIITGILTNLISAAVHAAFIFGLHFGIEGAAGALAISYFFQPLILIVYIKLRKLHKKTWNGWSLESLEEWPQYLKLAIPGVFMTSVENISYNVFQIILGMVDPVELTVNGILLNFASIIWMVPYGCSIAIAIRVGNELGKGNVLKAKQAIFVASVTILVAIVTMLCIILGLRTKLGVLFNAKGEVINSELETAVLIYCLQLFADHLQTFLCGVVRGIGHQRYGAVINQVSYFAVGLPIGIGLVVVGAGMGTIGVWIGHAAAAYLQLVSISIVLLRVDWNKEAELAMKRGLGDRITDMTQGGADCCESSDEDTSTMESNQLIKKTLKDTDTLHENKQANKSITTVRQTQINKSFEAEIANNAIDDTIEDLYSHKDEHSTLLKRNGLGKPKLLSTTPPDDDHKQYGTDNGANVDHDESGTAPPEEGLKDDDTRGCMGGSQQSNGLLVSHRIRLVLIHIVIVSVGIGCMIVSGITSLILPYPVGLMNGNYSDCSTSYNNQTDYTE